MSKKQDPEEPVKETAVEDVAHPKEDASAAAAEQKKAEEKKKQEEEEEQ